MKEDNQNIINDPAAEYNKEYTYADYIKFEFDEMVELIKGKIFKMSPAPKSYHQEILMNLSRLVANFLVGRSCKVYPAPFDVILPFNLKDKNKARSVVQPDISVVCNLSKIEDAGCVGAPDWVIEILSDSTSKTDLNDKYDLYEEAGVKEYWIVYPKDYIVQIFVLVNGVYERRPAMTRNDKVSSYTMPDLEIDLSDVFPLQ